MEQVCFQQIFEEAELRVKGNFEPPNLRDKDGKRMPLTFSNDVRLAGDRENQGESSETKMVVSWMNGWKW